LAREKKSGKEGEKREKKKVPFSKGKHTSKEARICQSAEIGGEENTDVKGNPDGGGKKGVVSGSNPKN